jgi:hypothetical protein
LKRKEDLDLKNRCDVKKFLLLLLLFSFLILPVMAEEWVLIPGTNASYDKDSVRWGDYGIVSFILKNPSDKDFELRIRVVINRNTKRFSYKEAKLYDINKQKYVYREFINSDWRDIPPNSHIRYLYDEVCHN